MKAMDYPVLETPRLILKPLEIADANAIQQLLPRWEVVRFLFKGIPWPYPPNGADDFLRHVALPRIEKGTLWAWSLRARDNLAQVMGIIELYRSSRHNIAFWLAPKWQRHGYMTEAVGAVTDFWFDELGHDRLLSSNAVENTASSRVAMRVGMRLIGHAHADFLEGDRLETEVWAITRDEWLAKGIAERLSGRLAE